jgi:hypothetical protein
LRAAGKATPVAVTGAATTARPGWCRLGRGCCCNCAGLGGGIDARNHLTRNYRLPVSLDNFNQHATIRCRQFEDDLVGLDVDQVFIPRDGFAGLLVPGNQGRFGD